MATEFIEHHPNPGKQQGRFNSSAENIAEKGFAKLEIDFFSLGSLEPMSPAKVSYTIDPREQWGQSAKPAIRD